MNVRARARHQKHSQAREAQKLLGIDSDSDDEADVRTSGKGETGKAASAALKPKVGLVGATATKANSTYSVPKLKPKPVSAKPQKARHLAWRGVVVLHRLWLDFHDVCIGNQDNRSLRHEGT